MMAIVLTVELSSNRPSLVVWLSGIYEGKSLSILCSTYIQTLTIFSASSFCKLINIKRFQNGKINNKCYLCSIYNTTISFKMFQNSSWHFLFYHIFPFHIFVMLSNSIQSLYNVRMRLLKAN